MQQAGYSLSCAKSPQCLWPYKLLPPSICCSAFFWQSFTAAFLFALIQVPHWWPFASIWMLSFTLCADLWPDLWSGTQFTLKFVSTQSRLGLPQGVHTWYCRSMSLVQQSLKSFPLTSVHPLFPPKWGVSSVGLNVSRNGVHLFHEARRVLVEAI